MKRLLDFGEFSAKTHRYLLWFWLSHIPVVVALYILLSVATFQSVTLLYITIASVWANVASHAAGEDAALAKKAAEASN